METARRTAFVVVIIIITAGSLQSHLGQSTNKKNPEWFLKLSHDALHLHWEQYHP